MSLSVKMITAVVLLIHGGGLFFLMIQKNAVSLDLNPQKVLVHTVTLKKPQETKMVQAPARPKKQPPKPKVVKKSEKKSLDKTQISKLQKAKEALANFKRSSPNQSTTIQHLSITPSEKNYTQSLVRALKSMLTLPEFGEVKIAITIDRSGRVTHLSVLGAESIQNQKMVERVLKEAKFSSFEANFSGEKEHTFAIVLKNDF